MKRTGSTRGKKVAEFTWEKDGVKIVVPVKMYVHNSDGYSRKSEGYRFYAEVEDGRYQASADGTDIQEVEAAIVKTLDAQHEIEWEMYMAVTVPTSGGNHYGYERSLALECRYYLVGRPAGGEPVNKLISPGGVNADGTWKPGYASGRQAKGIPESKEMRDHLGRRVTFVVPATPQRILAVKNALRTIELARERLLDAFSAVHGERTLELLSGVDGGPALIPEFVLSADAAGGLSRSTPVHSEHDTGAAAGTAGSTPAGRESEDETDET